MRVCSEIKNRGTRDVLMVVCDGLKGLPDAVNAVWEKTIVQTCIVHLLRNSFKYASKKDWAQIAKDQTSSRSTPPRLNPRRSTGSPSSPASGRSATRPLYGCGRTRGPNSCRSCGSTGK